MPYESDFRSAFDPNTGAIRVTQGSGSSSSSTVTQVASSASSTTILAAKASRSDALIYNDSSSVLYLLINSGTASTTNYSVQVPSQGYFELPVDYTGIIKGIWASANGNAYVTEF